jgi:GTPase SAR1 family protein
MLLRMLKWIAAYFFGSDKGYDWWGDGVEENYLAILGLKGSGKTRLQYHFRRIPYPEEDVNTHFNGDILGEYVINEGNRKIKISKGLDIQGTIESLRKFTETEIRKADMTFLNHNEEDKILGYFDFVFNANHKDVPMVLVGSRSDKLRVITKANSPDQIRQDILSKFLSHLSNNYDRNRSHIVDVLLVNLLEKKHLELIEKKLFKKS